MVFKICFMDYRENRLRGIVLKFFFFVTCRLSIAELTFLILIILFMIH